MPDWYLNPALTRFRAAVNARYGARRDLESDGTIGDTAHSARTSDHNPDPDGSVDAWDMDVDVNGRGQPYAADVEALKRVFQSHESSSYWIHNDQIARRANGWRRESYAYAGPSRNRHEKHVHWNTRQSHETSTAPWILEDDMTPKQLEEHNANTWQIRNVPGPDGKRYILTGAMGLMVQRLAALEKTVAALANAAPTEPITPAQLAEILAAAEREAREEVRDALRDAADAATPQE